MTQHASIERHPGSGERGWESSRAAAGPIYRCRDAFTCSDAMVRSPGAYERVVSEIEEHRGSSISVPDLSKLLGVKPTTLNARFRREHIEVQTVGRTNYIPCDLAMHLAELHKYALFGWPTLQEASAITTVKDATLKARCEKGKLEGYIDLTKRLRVNPADLERLRSCLIGKVPNGNGESVETREQPRLIPKVHRQSPARNGSALSTPRNLTTNGTRPEIKPRPTTPRNGLRDQVSLAARSLPLLPAPEPHIELITRKSYGLPEAEENGEAKGQSAKTRAVVQQRSAFLDYLPDQPFSISECSVGKVIYYGPYSGTIVKLINDPFTPRIQVSFPDHPHPAMREVQLVVGRRKSKS
ncbi:MAG: hypothetical protein HY298_13975 [Verrucomicrobia bacterium]|nr:hypothetical protein [Verrucomicrobiota bacterium]